MSFKPEVKVYHEDKWHRNGQVFATRNEALTSASIRAGNWTAVEDFRAVEVPTEIYPVNYKHIDGMDIMLRQEPSPEMNASFGKGE